MGSVLDLAPPVTVTDPLSHTTTFSYDAKGNLTTITVNPQNQPLTIKDSLNNITTFAYELGDLISVKQPVSRCAAITCGQEDSYREPATLRDG